MKVKRQKQARHLLTQYKNIFKFQEPFQILIDGTFAQAASKSGISILNQLTKYFGCKVHCGTTRCVLAELKLLGDDLQGALNIMNTFSKRACPHRGKTVPALECLKSVIGKHNDEKYFVATQDPDLTKFSRSTPGIPVLYIYQTSVILDKPSFATIKFIKEFSMGKLAVGKTQISSLKAMKSDAEIVSPSNKTYERRKRKKAKGPNPLSCKRKKTK